MNGSDDHNDKLKATLVRLEESTQKILATRGYGKDARSLKILEEMIKEQLTHANSRPSTRPVR